MGSPLLLKSVSHVSIQSYVHDNRKRRDARKSSNCMIQVPQPCIQLLGTDLAYSFCSLASLSWSLLCLLCSAAPSSFCFILSFALAAARSRYCTSHTHTPWVASNLASNSASFQQLKRRPEDVCTWMHLDPSTCRDEPTCEGFLTLCCSSADISLTFGLPSARSSNRMPSSGITLSRTLQVHCVSTRTATMHCILREWAGLCWWTAPCKGGVLSTAQLQEAHNGQLGAVVGQGGHLSAACMRFLTRASLGSLGLAWADLARSYTVRRKPAKCLQSSLSAPWIPLRHARCVAFDAKL